MNFVRTTVKAGCIDISGQKLDISKNLGKHAAAYEGKEIYFGFRPEAIKLGRQDGAHVLDAQVELTEMLGDSTNVYVNIGQYNAILKVSPYETPEMDTPITFSIPLESTYLFDAETEMVID
jgi:multiple sugar transport system ATP-binding protein